MSDSFPPKTKVYDIRPCREHGSGLVGMNGGCNDLRIIGPSPQFEKSCQTAKYRFCHRSHFGSRYTSGCCGHANLFGTSSIPPGLAFVFAGHFCAKLPKPSQERLERGMGSNLVWRL